MIYLATIRQRGQLTIPDKIRLQLPWLAEGSAVHLTSTDPQTLIVKPYSDSSTAKPDWKKIWQMIKLTRSFKGKNGNLAAFIAKDRLSH